MHRIYFTLFCLAFIGLGGFFLTNDGNLLLNSFEADALHVAAGVLRLSEGEMQHIDFHTPLGILTFLPAKLLMQAGYGFGTALAYSNVVVTLLVLPALVWISLTRFPGGSGYAFAAVTLLLILSLNLGGLNIGGLDMALFYNRWCWAVAGLLFAAILLQGPGGAGAQVIDGIVIGACLSFLAMTKATYFVFLAPQVLLALLLFRRYTAILATVLTGATVILAIMVLTGGPDFMLAYVADLLAVSSSGLRTAPSQPIMGVILSPEFLVGNLALLAGGFALRGAGLVREWVIVLLLLPGIFLIATQNWGNFQQWTLSLSLILFALAQRQGSRQGTAGVKIAALVLGMIALPQLITMGVSLIHHSLAAPERYVTVLSDPRFSDLRFSRVRQATSLATVEMDFDFEAQYAGSLNLPAPDMLGGAPLPWCELRTAMPSYLRAIADALAAREDTRGKRILNASNASNYWLFGGTQRLRNGDIWYYGSDNGFSDADFLVVPLCTHGTMGRKSRRAILDLVADDPRYDFTEIDRNDLFILMARVRPDQ